MYVIPGRLCHFRAPSRHSLSPPVIPAPFYVIPAQAGIYWIPVFTGMTKEHMDDKGTLG